MKLATILIVQVMQVGLCLRSSPVKVNVVDYLGWSVGVVRGVFRWAGVSLFNSPPEVPNKKQFQNQTIKLVRALTQEPKNKNRNTSCLYKPQDQR